MSSYLTRFRERRVQQLIQKNKDKPPQGSDEWDRFRYDHFNASTAAYALSNEKIGKNATELEYEMSLPYKPPEPTTDPYLIRGHIQEPIIMQIYSKTTGSHVNVGFGSFEHYKHKFIAASVDGITNKGVIVEIKSRNVVLKDIPFKDWVQVQLQLAVMNLFEADYVQAKLVPATEYDDPELVYDNFRLVEYNCISVKRDTKWFKRVIPIFRKFWRRVQTHRINGTLPNKYDEWVVASEIRNYSLGDPLIDYLNKYHRQQKKIYKTPEYDFGNFFCQKGIEFEDMIISELKDKFGNDFITIWTTGKALNDNMYQSTIDAMKFKVPIIHHGPIRDSNKKIWGIPDLLVRADYLNKIIQTSIPVDPDDKSYRVVDIKLGVLDLTANGLNLLNNTKTKAYKGQLGFYNNILKTYPGQIDINKAFIIGRKWHYTSKNVEWVGNHWYERYGVIDFDNFDKYISITVDKAIKWVRDVRSDGQNWMLTPPSRPELRPNMKNDEDSDWKDFKDELAIKNGEITLLWQCGLKNRVIADKNNITNIYDSKISAELLGVNGPYQSRILNNILAANHQNNPLYFEDKTVVKSSSWFSNNNFKIFIDYETISELVYDSITGDLLFMIGAWANGNYKCWVVNSLTREEEKRIATEFFDWLKYLMQKHTIAIYYWSHFEATQTDKLIERHQLYDQNIIWSCCNKYDLCKEIQNAGIAAKGSFNYKLKKFTNALYKSGAITTNWGDNECSDGLKAMVMTYFLHKKSIKTHKPLPSFKEMGDIIRYNEIDCKSMYSILEYIKSQIIE